MNILIYVLIGLIAILLAVIIVLLVTRPKVVTLTDSVPVSGMKNAGVKLADNIRPYIKEKDGVISIKVVKED